MDSSGSVLPHYDNFENLDTLRLRSRNNVKSKPVILSHRLSFTDTLHNAYAGRMICMFNLGVMYEKGEIVAQNINEAFRWYEKAAAKNLNEAVLACDRIQELKKNQDCSQNSFHWCGQAEFNLGKMFEIGDKVAVDLNESLKWYELAEKEGYKEGKIAAARVIHLVGINKELHNKYDEAYLKYHLVSQKLHYAIPDIYRVLQKIKDHTQKISDKEELDKINHLEEKWKKHKQPSIKAKALYEVLSDIGSLYDKGIGEVKNFARAEHYYKKAISLGSVNAIIRLGKMYVRSDNLQYKKKGYDLIKEAAEKGDEVAKVIFKISCEKGMYNNEQSQ